jgi:hypothetical protein
VSDDQPEIDRGKSFVERTAGIFKTDRPVLTPRQEQDEFECGVAEQVRRTIPCKR